MAVITAQNVTKQFAARVVLDNVSIEIQAGEITGFVGSNGAGKTTLFRVLCGMIPPDLGTVTVARGVEIGLLAQEPQLDSSRTLHDEVGSAFEDVLAIERRLHAVSDQMAKCPEGPPLAELMARYDRLHEQFVVAGGHTFEARLREILGGLGFHEEDYEKPIATLSGGEKCRAALAKLLIQDCSMLLLDEPTNHLDIDAVRWLEKFLAGHRSGAVIISHDRYLLDRVCDRIVEIANAQLTSYPGDYTNYVQTRDRRALTLERQFEQDAAFIEKERDFIARHLAGQRSSEAKGRRTRLERKLAEGALVTERAKRHSELKIEFRDADQSRGVIMRADDLEMAYDERTLFRGLSIQLTAGQRLGITGPNGTGKSTLLRILLSQTPPRAGTVWIDKKCSVGYYAQEHNELDPNRTVIETIRSGRPDLDEQRARSILGGFLFHGDDVFQPIGTLSGGEQSRVRLLDLILQSPDVLVLDEPTNHLDIASRETLECALADFPGAIVAVSHDRYFLDRIVERLLILRPEGHTHFVGNYSAYLDHLENVDNVNEAKAAHKSSKLRVAGAAGTTKSKGKKTASPFSRMALDDLEEWIANREGELASLSEQFADPSIYKDVAGLAELRATVEGLRGELKQAETEWEERMAES